MKTQVENKDVCNIPIQRALMANESGTAMRVEMGNGNEMRTSQGASEDEILMEVSGPDYAVPLRGVVKSASECRRWVRENVRFTGALQFVAFDPDRTGWLSGHIAGLILLGGNSDVTITPETLNAYMQQHYPVQLITAANKWIPSFCPLCGSILSAGLGRFLNDMARCEPCGLSLDVTGCVNGLRIAIVPLEVLGQVIGEQNWGMVN